MAQILNPTLWGQYLAFRKNPANDETTDGMWCGQNKLQPDWLIATKVHDPKWAQELLDYRRSRMAEDILEVDKGLVAKAKAGNTQAASLLYARFEGWTPKVAESEAKRNPTMKTFAELVAEGGV
jgi:hypothetical protein